MYRVCNLVHSDFSEYNLLYYNNEVYVIDVSQAVEHEHPNALNFLKRDCHNINDFFYRNGINTLTDQQVFDYVSKWDIKEKELESFVEECRKKNSERVKENKKFMEIENGLFNNFEIPQSFMYEDVYKIAGNDDIEMAMRNLLGMAKRKEEEMFMEDDSDEEEEEEDDDDNEMEEEEVDDEKKKKEKKEIKDPFEGMTKKERKEKVKLENREKRQNKKLHKKEKQKLIKKSNNSRR